ncbi:hypothetical protein BASA50_007224 [Batrachochytrium salamandrivorans]|uniref:Prominin n=1 Tax=Batrachochytrium salamandrivorans TaxID=1357716 RepID=A0ABQ8F7R1_9FUNG|nr:hypothetical protein BASA50_007224 [Batrachochytrium salamandrivorans]
MAEEAVSIFSRSTSDTFSYTLPSYPLSTWIGIAKSIRIALRTSYSHVPVPSNFSTSNLNVSAYTGYYMPFAILVALIVISLIFTVMTVCCECCCLTCFRRYMVRRRIQVPNFGRKLCNVVSLVILMVIAMCAVAGTFYATGLLNTTLTTFNDNSVTGLNDTNGVVISIIPVINKVFDDIEIMVNSSIDAVVASVHFDVTNTSVVPALMNLASGLESTQISIGYLLGNATTVDISRSAFLGVASTIVATVNNISSLSTNLSSVAHPVNSYSWSLTQSINTGNINTAAVNILSDASSSPNSSLVLQSLNSVPNLTVYANQIRSTAETVPNAVRNLVSVGSTSFKGTAISGLENARSSIVSQFSGPIDNVSNQIKFILGIMSGYMATAIGYRGYVINLAFTPYYVLLHLLALVFVIITIPLGDVCTVIYEGSPRYISQVITGESAGVINMALDAVPLCYQNRSFIDVAIAVGMINGSAVNITQQASDKINQFNFSAVTSGWDVSSSVDTSNNPSSKLTNVNSIDLSAFNISTLDSARNNSIPALKNNLLNLDSNLNTLYNQASASTTYNTIRLYLSFSPASPAPSDSEAVACNNDFLTRVADIRSNIQSIAGVNGYLDQLNTSAIDLETKIVTLNGTATTLLSFTKSLPSLYNASIDSLRYFAGNATANLTVSIPIVKNNMIAFTASEQSYVMNSFPCYPVAQAYYAVQDGVCGGVLNTFDALWLTFSILAVVSFASIPIVILTANSLFPSKTGGTRGGPKKLSEAPAPVGVESTREMAPSPTRGVPPRMSPGYYPDQAQIYPVVDTYNFPPQEMMHVPRISITPEFESQHNGSRMHANGNLRMVSVASQPVANTAMLFFQPHSRASSQIYPSTSSGTTTARPSHANHNAAIMDYDVIDG